MNRTPVVFIVLGLIAACVVDAETAADSPPEARAVRMSGTYFAAGAYAENPSLLEKNKGAGRASLSLHYQRLRILTAFRVSEGLTLTTRCDALETVWGAGEQAPVASSDTAHPEQNISFEQTYVTFRTAAGVFLVGTQDFGTFGTEVLNSETVASYSGIKYILPLGSLTLAAAFRRNTEGVGLTTDGGGASDVDADVYYLTGIYRGQNWEAGLLYEYVRNAVFKPLAGPIPTAPDGPYLSTLHVFLPYARLTAGRLSLEAEGAYATGGWRTYERPTVAASVPDVTAETYALYVGAKITLGPAYLGGIFLYGRGDDYGTANRQEGGFAELLAAGGDFNPCLIFMNYWYTTRIGALTPASGGNAKSYFNDNLWLYQVYGGFMPADRLELRASYTLAVADKKPRTTKGLPLSAANREFVGDRYGSEVDFTAAYMIYDNLEYLVGAAYFFTGDYFKGDDLNAVTADTYLLIHRLTLTF